MKEPGTNQQPFYIRATITLFFYTLLFLGLYMAKSFLVPFSLAAILSILLYPFSSWLERKALMHRMLANLIVIILVMLVLGGLMFLLYTQLKSFVDELPQLEGKIDHKLTNIQQFIRKETGMSPHRQILWLQIQLQDLLASSGKYISSTLNATLNIVATVGMVQFYIFFFLYYRDKFRKFIFRMTPEANHRKVNNIITETQDVIQSYITGICIVIIIMTVFITSGLMILGIPFALFLGILTALLNVIPYIGIFISALLACIMTFLTKDSSWFIAGTMGVFLFTHILESNVFTPNIVGSKVSINPLATFIVLIVGGELWGIMGMILFIPFTGIIKVICDNVPELRPYGYLLGTEGTEEHNISMGDFWRKITFRKRAGSGE